MTPRLYGDPQAELDARRPAVARRLDRRARYRDLSGASSAHQRSADEGLDHCASNICRCRAALPASALPSCTMPAPASSPREMEFIAIRENMGRVNVFAARCYAQHPPGWGANLPDNTPEFVRQESGRRPRHHSC